MTCNVTLAKMEGLIRRDPAQRGLISSESSFGPLCLGHMGNAARHIDEFGQRAIIVTGFFIPGATPPSAETDGPPGAAMLAAAMKHIGMDVQLVTDEHCRSAIEVAGREMGLTPDCISILPRMANDQEQWFAELLRGPSAVPITTHLISIERVGPSHTGDSIARQSQGSTKNGPCERALFEEVVPRIDQDRCHNMRGECIDAHTGSLHRLFELSRSCPWIHTIGIGDGGNEIGMGSIRWGELKRRLKGPYASRIPCRIATDWTILAGVSNWGGQALAAAILTLRNETSAAANWTTDQQKRMLERLVQDGPAVDGITRRQEPTADGLPFEEYIEPWEGLRRLMNI
jgi:hypothetical protein